MEKIYQPQTIEKHWYKLWEDAGYFSSQHNSNASAYCIMLPPPNVTGSLHMGHGFQDTLMDALIRYQRMRGSRTLWQAGTDHAGIATQMVVERQLLLENKNRHDLGREAFIERVWAWKKTSGNHIVGQLRRLGASIDWDRECFTMDPHITNAVQEVFIQLYEEGLIYRGKRLVNWDPKLLTAISDLEVVTEEEDGLIWHIRYPIVDSDEFMIVATTRPETLFGDVAVAVHPDDERFKTYVGKEVWLPLANRKIPIIADSFVVPEFGTGCVKITPAHDFRDYAVGQRHHLELLNIFTPDIHLNENTPVEYQGLNRKAARQKALEDLESAELLVKSEPYKISVSRGDRSGEIIEPYLTDQWFVKTAPLAEPAIKAVESGEIRFVPENWTKTYFQWMHNIEDWCISRQLWWGHRIPAWYDEAGKIYVGIDEVTIRKKYELGPEINLTQDNDVLDTWFSSALWPFATLGWPSKTSELEIFYPTNVLVTGFDIIFFWVARMIMMGLKFTGQVPFKEVYVTGLIRDSEGHKMSKSKGNVLDPIDLIDGIELEALIKKRTEGLLQPAMAQKIKANTEKEYPQGIPAFGTDAVRFTYCALASTGRDIRFDLKRVEGYRNFCNKLWNAARYVLMSVGENFSALTPGASNTNGKGELISLADRYIQSALQKLIHEVTEHFTNYRFDLLAHALYEFVWNEFCDWYLELSKVVLNDPNSSEAIKQSTYLTLLNTLETVLRLIHPIMPFITEEIWQKIAPLLGKKGKTIMLEPYPVAEVEQIDENVLQQISWLKEIILAIRNLRSEFNIPPGKRISTFFYGQIDAHIDYTTMKPFIKSLCKLDHIEWIQDKSVLPTCLSALAENIEIFIPMEGLIDKTNELARLEKELQKIQKDLLVCNKKLENPEYVDKAPVEVVEKERLKLEALTKSEAVIRQQIMQLDLA